MYDHVDDIAEAGAIVAEDDIIGLYPAEAAAAAAATSMTDQGSGQWRVDD